MGPENALNHKVQEHCVGERVSVCGPHWSVECCTLIGSIISEIKQKVWPDCSSNQCFLLLHLPDSYRVNPGAQFCYRRRPSQAA